MDYGKNDSLIKLLYTIAQGNLDQIMGEETEKLEAVKNICDISKIQLQKVKKTPGTRRQSFKQKSIELCGRHFVVFTATEKEIL